MKMLNRKRSQKGSAIVMVMIAVFVLAITGVGLLSLGVRGRIQAIRTANEIEARTAADAGLDSAVYQMNQLLSSRKFSDSSMPSATNQTLPSCDALYSYKVGAVSGKNEFIVASVGSCGSAIKSVSATLGLKGLYEFAILSRSGLVLKSDTVIDGYNSADLSDTDNEVQIATTSTAADQIVLNNNVTVDGDVLVGVNGNPSVTIRDLGGTTGLRRSMTEEPPLPEITVPPLKDMSAEIYLKGTTVTIGPAASGTYTGIRILQNSEKLKGVTSVYPGILVIDGGAVSLHITGDIWLGELCEIVVNNGSSLKLYIDGDIVSGANSSIGYTGSPQEPAHLWLYATGDDHQSFDFKAKSDWSGVVYAPNADVDLYACGDVYGAFVAYDFEFKAGGNFYYDEALRNVSIYDYGVRFIVKRWSER